MNKYEQLIEFIINEQEDKARELFHQIVVEKSREIYETLIDEQDLEEVGGNQVEQMVDEITMDEEGMQEDEEEGMSMDSEDDGGHGDLSLDGDDDEDDEEDGEDDGDLENRVMDLEDTLDELQAKFDAQMAKMMGDDGDDEAMDTEVSMDMDDEMPMSMDDEDGADKMPEGQHYQESKKPSRKMTEAEWIREYVEKVGEYPGNQASPSGHMVGTGAKSEKAGEKNVKGPVGPGVNMGGNVVRTKGGEQNPDGKQIEQPANEYTKGKGDLPGAGKYKNVPGSRGDSFKDKAPSATAGEASGTNDKSPLKHIAGK